MIRSCCLLFVTLVLANVVEVWGQNWAAFRGDIASGSAALAQLPTTWDVAEGKQVAWKVKVPGLGHSSPIAWGQQVYITTAISSDQKSI